MNDSAKAAGITREFLLEVLRTVPAFVVCLDADDRIVYINRVGPSVTMDQVIGSSPQDWVDPDQRTIQERMISEAKRVRQPQRTRVSRRDADGKRHYYDSVAIPMKDRSGRTTACIVTQEVTDAVERAEALTVREAQLRLAVDATQLGLWSWDVETDEVEWNQQMHRITGRAEPTTPAEYLEQLVYEPDRALIQGEIDRVGSGDLIYPSHRIVRPDGEVRWVQPVGTVSRDKVGRTTKIMGGTIDITEQRRVDEQLREAQKLDAIGGLTAGVAHNFNNMLAVLMPALDLARRSAGERERAVLDEAHHAARRAADLVAQLMTFAGQRGPSKRRVVDVSEMANVAVSLCKRMFDKRVSLRLTPAGSPVYVRCDPSALEQVVVNLLINARDAVLEVERRSPTVDVAIAVEPSPSESATKRAIIRVTDNGTGIESDACSRVFEPFFTTKEPGRGTGLGLSTSYAIVREHGGQITVTSQVGVGSTFEVWLPLAEADEETGPLMAKGALPASVGRILFVDDEPAIREVVGQLLALRGHEVDTAATRDEALVALRTRPAYDAIVIDRSLFGRDATEEIAGLRELAPDTPILLYTGQEVPALEARAAEAVLVKPLGGDELAVRIEEWIRPKLAKSAAR